MTTTGFACLARAFVDAVAEAFARVVAVLREALRPAFERLAEAARQVAEAFAAFLPPPPRRPSPLLAAHRRRRHK